MTGHLRIKSPITQLGVLLFIYFVSYLILGSIMQVFLDPKTDFTAPGNIASMKWIQALSSLIIFFLPAFLYAVLSFRGNYFHFLGFKPAEKASMYLLGVGCILLAFPLVFWLGDINQRIPMPPLMLEMEKQAARQMEAFLKVNGPADIVINVIVIALLPSIAEEMFFRGAMQRIIIQLTRKPWVGIVLTAALFSALHFQFQGFLPRMFLGVVLGALYWFSGSLWTSILAHFIINAIQVLAASYATKYISENPVVPFYLAILSAAAVFGILRLYQRLSTITWSKVYDRSGLTPHNNFIS